MAFNLAAILIAVSVEVAEVTVAAVVLYINRLMREQALDNLADGLREPTSILPGTHWHNLALILTWSQHLDLIHSL